MEVGFRFLDQERRKWAGMSVVGVRRVQDERDELGIAVTEVSEVRPALALLDLHGVSRVTHTLDMQPVADAELAGVNAGPSLAYVGAPERSWFTVVSRVKPLVVFAPVERRAKDDMLGVQTAGANVLERAELVSPA